MAAAMTVRVTRATIIVVTATADITAAEI